MCNDMRAIFALLLLTAPAAAADFSITDQDQTALQQICDIAARSGELNREQRAQVSSYCVVWANRIKEAADKAAVPKTAEKTETDPKK